MPAAMASVRVLQAARRHLSMGEHTRPKPHGSLGCRQVHDARQECRGLQPGGQASRAGRPGQEGNQPLADANDADGDEDPPLNEDGCQRLLIGDILCSSEAHHLQSAGLTLLIESLVLADNEGGRQPSHSMADLMFQADHLQSMA